MKKTKMEKGITLIALIITIIILLILAVVALNAASGEDIIEKADGAVDTYVIGQEKEEIQLGLNEWKLAKYQGEKQTFKAFMISRLSGKANVDGAETGPLTVMYTATNNTYEVTDEEIKQVKEGINITPTTLELTVGGEAGKVEATLTGGLAETETEKIQYESSDEEKATVDEQGNVTAVAVGEATITAKFGTYTATCTVTVKEAEPEVISIAGTYGDTSGDYYVFSNDGTGEFIENKSSPVREEKTAITYTVNKNLDGTITGTFTLDGETDEISFIYEERKDGENTNKLLYCMPVTVGWSNENTLSYYAQVWTTNGLVGLGASDRIDGDTYPAVDSDHSEYQFSNGTIIGKKSDGTTETIFTTYFKRGNIIYTESGAENLYCPWFAFWEINGVTYIEMLWS